MSEVYWLSARNTNVQYQWCSKVCLIKGVAKIEAESSDDENSDEDE